MKTNIIYREEGFLVLEKEKINFDVLVEWFICHLNDYVYVMNDKEFEGLFVKHGGNPLYISCVICNHTRFLYSIT